MADLFDKVGYEPGPLGRYADVREDYFMFPKLEGGN